MKRHIPFSKTNFMLSLCLSTVLNAACNIQATNAANLSAVEFAQLNRHAEIKQVEEGEDFLSREEEELLLNSDDEVSAREELFEVEDAVILLQGSDSDGKEVFAYLQISLNSFRDMKQAVINGEEFEPSDYGEIVYTGYGSPSPEVREEMAERFGVMSAPTAPPSMESNYER